MFLLLLFSVPFMDGWFKYEKDFERAQKEDNRGVIFILHYESLKKVRSFPNYLFFFNSQNEILLKNSYQINLVS